MFGVILGVLTIGLGIKAFSAKGLPVSKTQNLTGMPGKTVGIVCILLGIAFIADGCIGAANLMKLLSKPMHQPPPAIDLTTQVKVPEKFEPESELAPAIGPEVWVRYDTFDHVCSAEFPAEPKRAQNKVDFIELRQMLLQRRPGKGFFALNLVTVPPEMPSQSLDEAVATFRGAFGAVSDHAIKQGDVDGWELDFVMSEKVSMNRIFKWKQTIYRANVVIDRTANDDADAKRFFDSIQFNLQPEAAEAPDTTPDATKPANESQQD